MKVIKFESILPLSTYIVVEYVACSYDDYWWIGLIVEVDEEGVLVKFLHPHGPASSFYWPDHDDTCWVPKDALVCKITT